MKEEDLPIDIYYNKLLDWLIDRRHCNPKWQEKATLIRKKINTAIQDMPPNEDITYLLSGTYINFFHCQRIIQLLKECGEGSTNFFGQYSSQRMKDWQEIINDYQTENCSLAEASHMLIRNVNYEIPALKRQIGKCQQLQRECLRKEEDCAANAAVFKEKYLKICRQMGIVGDNVRKELVHLVDELPSIFADIAEKAKLLKTAVAYYQSFVQFVVDSGAVIPDDISPLIRFIIENGNATVYQWKTGEKPSKVIENVQTIDLDEMVKITEPSDGKEDGEIDWGDNNDVIDFGDYGNGDSNAIDYGDNDNIDWGNRHIDLAGAEIQAITIEDAGQENPEGGVATGNEALSVLENHATRNVFIDELMEIEAFLEQRLEEMNVDADMITINQFQSAPDIIQHQTKENIQTMLSNVSRILKEMSSVKMQNLYLIKSSTRYVDRIAESLEQKLKISENLLKQIETLKEKRNESLQLHKQTEPKLQVLVKKTKELQSQMELEISKKYKNRKVNIMGEINTI